MRFGLPAAFAVILCVLTLTFLPIVDPDFFWHVKIGELVLESGRLPRSEVFSHTAADQAWVVQGWFSDVVLHVVWNSAGVFGVRALIASLLVATWWVIYRSVRLYVHRPETALILSAVGVALLEPAVAPRPTIATALGLAVVLHSLLAYRRSGQSRWLLALPLSFAVWPNVHFGYLAGMGLALLFMASDVLERLVPLKHALREPGVLIGARPMLVGLLCVAAVGANPHGYIVLWDAIQMAIDGAQSPISEWQSPSFGNIIGKLVYFGIAAFFVARAFARKSVSWLDLVVPLAVIGAALSAARHIALMGVVLAPFLARAVASWDSRDFDVRLGRLSRSAAIASREMGPRASSRLNMALVATVTLVLALVLPTVNEKFDEVAKRFQPSGAADFILEHELKGPLFNTYNGGGYLIYRLYPRERVFIDGRYNPYPKRVFDDYLAITNGAPDWFVRLESYSVNVIVSETTASFRQLLLLRPEFRLVYEDPYFSVLVRDIDLYRALPTVEPQLSRAPDPA